MQLAAGFIPDFWAIVWGVIAFENKQIIRRFARLFQNIGGGMVGLDQWSVEGGGTIAANQKNDHALSRSLGFPFEVDPWPQLHGIQNPSLNIFFKILSDHHIPIPDDGVDLAAWGAQLEARVERGEFENGAELHEFDQNINEFPDGYRHSGSQGLDLASTDETSVPEFQENDQTIQDGLNPEGDLPF